MTNATRTYLDKTLIITLVHEGRNPKRKPSKSFDRFELYKTGMTIAEYIAAGGVASDVLHDMRKGHITVAAAA